MSNIAYKTIVEKAKIIKKSVEQNQKMLNHRWGYYFAKAILNPGKNIPNIGKYTYAPRQHGDHISTQIQKTILYHYYKRFFLRKNYLLHFIFDIYDIILEEFI